MEIQLTKLLGHRNAYNGGVLHRDISGGNILIKIRRASGGEADAKANQRGVLIDFDNATRYEDGRHYSHDPLTVRLNF